MAKKLNRPEFLPVNEDDLKPGHRWHRPLQAPGTTQVDFEERVDFRRLHRYRLARTREALAKSGMGAMLSFDQYNIRYISSTVIGEWARDKLIRYCLLTGTGDPWVWDFGSAARHHRIYCPWLHEDHIRAGNPGMRGAIGPEAGLFKQAAKEMKDLLKQEGVADMPLGLDVCEPPMLFALQEQGIEVRDGQQMMLAAREIKSHDEITLLNIASSMVDGVYQDIAAELKPGVKESQIVALATKRLYEMGSDCVEAINSISGERCSPHPHNFTDRLIRPGDQAYFDIIHSFIGYRTCYYRTFTVGSATQSQRDAYKRARQWMDDAIAMLKPGLGTDKAAEQLPKASDIGGFGQLFGGLVGAEARLEHGDRVVHPLARALIGIALRLRRAADGECAVIARAIADEGMDDVEIRLIARTDQPVGEVVRMRAAALARNRIDRFDTIGSHFIQTFRCERDDLAFLHTGLQFGGDILVHAIHHARCDVQQRDLVVAFDLTRGEHHLLAVADLDALFLQGEQHRGFAYVEAQRHIRDALLLEKVFDFLCGLFE